MRRMKWDVRVETVGQEPDRLFVVRLHIGPRNCQLGCAGYKSGDGKGAKIEAMRLRDTWTTALMQIANGTAVARD